MFQVLILICSIGVSRSDCQIETATDVIQGPVVANEIMCALHGQAYIAPTAIAPRPDKEYVKLKCQRAPAVKEALQRRATRAAAGGRP